MIATTSGFFDDLKKHFLTNRFIWGGKSLVIRLETLSYSLKHNFRTYIQQYSSPDLNYEYGNPHSHLLFHFYKLKKGICVTKC